MSNPRMIKIEQLHFAIGGNIILNGLDFNFEKGKFYAALGPNGSGKTTLLRHIAKTLEVKPGTIFLNGEDLQQIEIRRLAREIATVPQDTVISFEFSVGDIVLMGRNPYLSKFATETETDLEIVRNAMEVTDTWQLRDRSINSLSGGERQRVILARAIAQETGVILLDEPITYLDIYHQVKLLKCIKALSLEHQVTIIAVLHDLNLAASFSDSLILMKQGKIVCHGSPEEILNPEIIKGIYGIEVDVIKVPTTGKPHVILKTDS